jgi:glutamine cyclotransferase
LNQQNSGAIFVNRSSKLFAAGLIAASGAVFVLLCVLFGNGDTPAIWGYKIVKSFDHDREAFTQGLVFEDGFLYEGTGLFGSSALSKVELETGNVVQTRELPPEFFGEGITIYGDNIIQLTLQSNVGFVYNKETFELLRQFNYQTEGWGITHDGKHLIMSDGTPMLYFLDPNSFERVHKVMVLEEEKQIWGLNELEYVDGQIYANVWPTERIARIDPRTGQIIGWIDMKGLADGQDDGDLNAVLNGIAYDPVNKRLFVTGKNWPQLFEIKLTGPK